MALKYELLQGPSLQRSNELINRGLSQRSCFLGVETQAVLVWEKWELGKEYTKTLQLNNVHSKLLKLRFRPPKSKFFTTPYPQTISLSPGLSFSLPVTFRPLEKCEYVDSIEFQGKEGSFQVSLQAAVPQHMLELPESVLLPPCAVHHSSQTTFLFRNASKLRTGFRWELASPFQLSPDCGVLEPGEERRLTVLFHPQGALVYQREARCLFGDEGESSCTLLVRGLSKYPLLQIRSQEQDQHSGLLDFGSVAVGATVESHFEIYNSSSVSAHFTLSWLRRSALLDRVFRCEVREGLLAPQSALKVPVCFSPCCVDTSSVDYLSLACPGAVSKNLLKVTGTCFGPSVSLSSPMLNFGCVEEGGEASCTVQITNSSTVPAYYQFDTDTNGHSVFTIDQPCGTLAANSNLTLCVCFRPHHPIAHHRRVACLVLHREPLFLDLIGTCHSEQQKPSILSPRHLHMYRKHLQRGLTSYPPDLLSDMLAENKLRLDEDETLLLQEVSSENSDVFQSLADRKPEEEYYHSNGVDCRGKESQSSPFSHVTVQPTELLFYSEPASQYVYVTNHTKGKLSLLWTSAENSPFSVSPSTCEHLGPLKTTTFRVTYNPKEHNTFHAAQLECFALYTLLRDHCYTEDQTLCPSWCIRVRVSGHSFQPGKEHFIPRLCVQQPRVLFPALNQVAYRNVLLQNTGDLPLIFKLDPKECPSVCVLPSSGMILPGSHQILMLRSLPAEDHPVNLPLRLQLNGLPNHIQELSVVSRVERAHVAIEGDGEVYFQPTAVGGCSQRSLWVRNMSSFPLQFQWKVWSPDARVLSVQPNSGPLLPGESKMQTWSFSPAEEKLYNMKASLSFWPRHSEACKRSRITVKALGMAAKGNIEAEWSVLELGDLLVGGSKTFEIPLFNRGSCPACFSLTVHQSIVCPDSPETVYVDPLAMELDVLSGTIPSCSRLLIRSTVQPARRVHYCWTISYQTVNASGCAVGNPESLCRVQGEGVYPCMGVTDACGCGSVEGLSKLQLWSLFSLDTLNAHLRRDPSPNELTYRVPTRHSLRRCPPVFTSDMVDFNFSAASLGSDPSSVLLMFENTANIPVQWSFLYPEDQQIELEYWAESGDFTPTELHQMKVRDNRLFSISPRSGKLLPGQQRAVQFTYRHDFTGTNRLPVLLKLSYGREILLNFLGITVERDRSYIYFASTKHTFSPVAIGGFSPPKQVYELYNGGALPVTYHVDTSPLEQLMEENFNHPVLQCLTPDGEVQPGCTAQLEWVLSPLEAKTYSVDIPIHVVGGDCTLVTFEGCGVHDRGLGRSKPVQLHTHHLSVPHTQRVPFPGQMGFLSEEMVSFGDVPVWTRSTRILFLSNVSHTDRILYTWRLTDQSCQQAVKIHPVSGTLMAGESALCIITLQTSGTPTFYQLDLVCEVTAEKELIRYHADLQQWQDNAERQKHEFTLTEKDVTHTIRSQQDKRAQNLPPIHRSSSSAVAGGPYGRSSKTERSTLRQTDQARRAPQPPRPALLHLGVTASSHSLLEYQTHFPALFKSHYVSRCHKPETIRSGSSDSQQDSTVLPSLSHGPVRDIITGVLASVLGSLLDEPQFRQSLVNCVNEPVPYFSQLGQVQTSPSTAVPPSDETSSPRTGTVSSSPVPDQRHRDGRHSVFQSEADVNGVCEPDIQQRELQQEQMLNIQETIRRSAEFGELVEDILLNTLQNLMMEAFLGELDLTAKPRIIALPPISPRRNSCGSRRPSRGHTKSERSREVQGRWGAHRAPYMPLSALLSKLWTHS
ncbi:cilia- and flagella-associated protein 65 [Chanos chanos]|uniref:Cilia- and flagella-associated protein 65 n=1 Tax=Chanos chanos TaxID=29144 RepID=A0A6J2WAZ1_CHACN|nr:cilia- and flagella-associated protein 65 [Chanos chanos]